MGAHAVMALVRLVKASYKALGAIAILSWTGLGCSGYCKHDAPPSSRCLALQAPGEMADFLMPLAENSCIHPA